jgi:hypothetical protein
LAKIAQINKDVIQVNS